jgi:hypothetical protein
MGQLDTDKKVWMPVVDNSWHSATGHEFYLMKDSIHRFGTK